MRFVTICFYRERATDMTTVSDVMRLLQGIIAKREWHLTDRRTKCYCHGSFPLSHSLRIKKASSKKED